MYLIAWVRRIIFNPQGTASNITRAFCGEPYPELIWAAKYSFSDTIAPVSPFYSLVIKTWQCYHNTPPNSEADIRRETIWNNPRIPSLTQNRSRIRWSRWIEAGIWTVGQICHPTEGRILGQQEINDKFHIEPTFLEALSIRNFIPVQWKRALTYNYDDRDSVQYDMTINNTGIDLLNSCPKKWYAALVQGLQQTIKRQESWSNDFAQTGVQTHIDWEAVYTLPFKITRETKLQSFHYRITHRLITCNKYLYTIRIHKDGACSTCGAQDTLTHFFVTCGAVTKFWSKLSEWCQNHLGFSLASLSNQEKILGLPDENGNRQSFKRINWLLLTAKFYLHRQRLFHNGELSLIAYLAEIKAKLQTERQACFSEARPQKFKTWEPIFKILYPNFPSGD